MEDRHRYILAGTGAPPIDNADNIKYYLEDFIL